MEERYKTQVRFGLILLKNAARRTGHSFVAQRHCATAMVGNGPKAPFDPLLLVGSFVRF